MRRMPCLLLWLPFILNPLLSRCLAASVEYDARIPQLAFAARGLYDAWAATSEIIPQINSACYKPNDAMIAPEGCIAREGFLAVDDYYFDPDWHEPMYGSGIRSVLEWGQAVVAGKELEGITPLQVADALDADAATALAALPKLRTQAGSSVELRQTLNDIESMAYLGRYYADKTRGAAKLAAFREGTSWKGGNIKYVEVDRDLNPLGHEGERSVHMDPPPEPPLKDRYRGAEFYFENDTLHMHSSGSSQPRIIVYATAKAVADPNSAVGAGE